MSVCFQCLKNKSPLIQTLTCFFKRFRKFNSTVSIFNFFDKIIFLFSVPLTANFRLRTLAMVTSESVKITDEKFLFAAY